MESKKLNIFTLLLVIVMCAFSIGISTRNAGGKDGTDGKDGSDMSVVSMYQEYKEANPAYTGSLSDFINEYLGDVISTEDELTQASLSAQIALCSTVDICYSYMVDEENYYNYRDVVWSISGEKKYGYQIITPDQPLMNVAAGSGVIYKMTTEGTKKTAYLITNYHVVYVEAYSNDPAYKVFYNDNSGDSFVGNGTITPNGFYGGVMLDEEVTLAPTDVHFLPSYSVYLNGYQERDYALSASFVGGSSENDIAVLKIEYDSTKVETENNKLIFNGNYMPAEIKNSEEVKDFEYAIAVGNPLIPNTSDINMSQITTYEQYLNAIEDAYINSLCLTTTGGRISQTTCTMPFSSLLDDTKTNNMRLMQVDVAINPGNSGGGLFNYKGELIGIVNGKIVDTNYDNVGFAIPINIASRVADQIIAQCDGTDQISLFRLTIKNSLELALEEKVGINKPSVSAGVWSYEYDVTVSKAPEVTEKGFDKFEAGDIIKSVKFEGEETAHQITQIHELEDLLLLAKYAGSGQKTTVTFEIVRDNENVTVNVEFVSSDFIEII